jgi:hypothetical protein
MAPQVHAQEELIHHDVVSEALASYRMVSSEF